MPQPFPHLRVRIFHLLPDGMVKVCCSERDLILNEREFEKLQALMGIGTVWIKIMPQVDMDD